MENVGLPKFIRPRPYWIQYVSTYIVFFLSLFVCKIKVNGKKNIPKGTPFVLASNHFGYFDPLVLVHAIRNPIDFIMQKELGIELHFLFAPMIYGAILTDRNKVGPSTIKESIKKGKILGIFPEGGITSTELTKAKPGAIFIASKANTQILPVSVSGGDNAWDDLFKGVRSRIIVNIGKPFGPFNIKGSKEEKISKLDEYSQELMCRIAALLPDDRHGEYANDKRIASYRVENKLDLF
jgi:1-acyl-sn-glycerol-3-phosphate acyltransferase